MVSQEVLDGIFHIQKKEITEYAVYRKLAEKSNQQNARASGAKEPTPWSVKEDARYNYPEKYQPIHH